MFNYSFLKKATRIEGKFRLRGGGVREEGRKEGRKEGNRPLLNNLFRGEG